jgi:hypothetical protein
VGIVLATLFGAPMTAFVTGAALLAFLPTPEDVALAVSAHVIVPLWVALACALPLASTAKHAFQICSAITLPLAAALLFRALT